MKQREATQWLGLVGIGEDGIESLCQAAQALISEASLVVGGRRHLALVQTLIQSETLVWSSPLDSSVAQIVARRGTPVCVLASGDPFMYGIGSTLVRDIPIEEMRVFPAPSAFSLAASRLGWALQHTVTIGLNGRPLERIIPHLQPGAHIIAISTDETTPSLLAQLLVKRGLGTSRMTVLECLGGPKERVRETTAQDFSYNDLDKLNCIALEVADVKALTLPNASGLDDHWFEHDGQLTKREIRAVTVSSLAPRKGELLWDIGLGAGSIAIEWMLAHSANRAIGIERDSERAERAARNAQQLGVPGLTIIGGEAPAALAGLEAPDAVFIGGGATQPGLIEAVWHALKPGGRLVANAVSLETEALLLEWQRIYGGTLIRIGVERAESIGTMTGWRPAMTVMQWSVSK